MRNYATGFKLVIYQWNICCEEKYVSDQNMSTGIR